MRQMTGACVTSPETGQREMIIMISALLPRRSTVPLPWLPIIFTYRASPSRWRGAVTELPEPSCRDGCDQGGVGLPLAAVGWPRVLDPT